MAFQEILKKVPLSFLDSCIKLSEETYDDIIDTYNSATVHYVYEIYKKIDIKVLSEWIKTSKESTKFEIDCGKMYEVMINKKLISFCDIHQKNILDGLVNKINSHILINTYDIEICLLMGNEDKLNLTLSFNKKTKDTSFLPLY